MVERTELFTGLVHLVHELEALGLELPGWDDPSGTGGIHDSQNIGIDQRR